jgi:RNA-directed DNA polymerase
VPLEATLKRILEQWLKAGILYLNKYETSEQGTPQGGILSPTLANFVLNGLERAIIVRKDYNISGYNRLYFGTGPPKNIVFLNSVTEAFPRKMREEGKSTQRIRSKHTQLKCIRYADDFVVLARSQRMIIQSVKPAVEEFLRERGLYLSQEKTKIISIIKGEKLNFLGYCFQYFNTHKTIPDNLGRAGIVCYPQKTKVLGIIKIIKDIIKKSMNKSSYQLISELNPIIRRWCNYFNLSQSYKARNYLEHRLFKLTFKWCTRKHPDWGKKKIAKHYYLYKENASRFDLYGRRRT